MVDSEGFRDEGGSLERINEDSLERWRVIRAGEEKQSHPSPNSKQKPTAPSGLHVPHQILAQYRASKSKIDLGVQVLDQGLGRPPAKQKLSVAVDRKFKRFETVRSSSDARPGLADKKNMSLDELSGKKPKFLLPSTTANGASQPTSL